MNSIALLAMTEQNAEDLIKAINEIAKELSTITWMDYITAIAGIASVFAVIISIISIRLTRKTLKEMQEERDYTYRPFFAFKNLDYMIEEGEKITPISIPFTNVGNGFAQNVRITGNPNPCYFWSNVVAAVEGKEEKKDLGVSKFALSIDERFSSYSLSYVPPNGQEQHFCLLPTHEIETLFEKLQNISKIDSSWQYEKKIFFTVYFRDVQSVIYEQSIPANFSLRIIKKKAVFQIKLYISFDYGKVSRYRER